MNKIRNISQSDNSGKFVISNLQQYEQKLYAESPSVKMVLSGEENYKVNGHSYTLDQPHFLIIDSYNHVEINIDAKKEVNGICIFPKKELLNEVAKTHSSTVDNLLDNSLDNKEIRLIHNRFKFTENATGKFLQQNIPMILQLHNQETIDFQEFYFGLAEAMVYDHLDLNGKLKNVVSAKRATKEELYRRVIVAKHFMDENFTQNICLDDLAQEAFLSKYHFTRTFKRLFGSSPYQYLLQLRLKKAQQLILLDYSYNEVSNIIGFSDGKNLRKAMLKMRSA